MRRVVLTTLFVVASLFISVGGAQAVQNGTPAASEAPWAVRIATPGYPTECSGAAIAAFWVLTAAHCVINESTGALLQTSQFTIWVNGSSYSADGIATPGAGLSVLTPAGTGSDVALIHLKTSLKPNLAKPLPLAPSQAVAVAFVNKGVTFFGFGRTSPNGPTTTVVQKLPDGAFYETPYCQFGSPSRCFLKTRPYGLDNSAVLPGDSGGPWVVWEDGAWVEVAVEHGGLNPNQRGDLGLQAGAEVGGGSVRNWIVSQVGELIAPAVGTILRNSSTGAAWIVGDDGFRRWIPDGGTYQCLVAQGHVVEPRDQFDIEAVPDRIGSWASASCSTGQQPPPSAAGYRVVNADGGVYWRSGPDWNSAVRVNRWGVYTNDRVALLCWTRGGTVPPYNNNPLWYRASMIRGQGTGSGFVNDHFLATSTNFPNVPEPGVPQCDQGPPPPPATPTGLAVSAVTSSGFTVSWSPVTNADDYVIYLDGARMLSFGGTSFPFQGMACGQSHVVGLQAESAYGASGIATVPASTSACASTLAGMHLQVTLTATPHTPADGGSPVCSNLGPDQLFAYGSASSGALTVKQIAPSSSGWTVSNNGLYAVVELTPGGQALQFAVVDIGVTSASGNATFTTQLGPGCAGPPITPGAPLTVTATDAHQPSSLLSSCGVASYTRIGDTFTVDVTFVGGQPCVAPGDDVPTITGVSNNAGVTGGPAFLVHLDFTDSDCDVVGGTWTDQFGTPHDFGYGNGGGFSSGCTAGVGFTTPGYASCTSPDGVPGQPGEYFQTIVLRDTDGHVSAPFVFPVICTAP